MQQWFKNQPDELYINFEVIKMTVKLDLNSFQGDLN